MKLAIVPVASIVSATVTPVVIVAILYVTELTTA